MTNEQPELLAPAGDWDCVRAAVANGADAAGAIGDRLTGPAAVCWYAKSTLVAPVFIAQVKTQDKTQDAASLVALKTAVDKTFGDVIGAYEAKAAKTDGNDADYTNYRRLPVTRRDLGADVTVWQRPVSARSELQRSNWACVVVHPFRMDGVPDRRAEWHVRRTPASRLTSGRKIASKVKPA